MKPASRCRGLEATVVGPGQIELIGEPASVAPTLCEVLADLGAPLLHLDSGHGSLDDVFVHGAEAGTA